MRFAVALIFAVLATIGLMSMPLWAGGSFDVKETAPGDEFALVKRMVEDLRAHDTRDALAITAEADRPSNLAIFDQIAALFPKTSAKPKLSVSNWTKMFDTNGGSTQMIVFYDYGRAGVVRAQALIIRDKGALRIASININHFSAAAVHANDFRWPESWRDIRWIYLGIAMAFDAFAFATFALCLISPVVRWRWRWLWLLFVLGGALRFNIDWSTLQSEFLIMQFLAPPAGFYKFLTYGSWVLSIGAPIGAMIYWAMRWQWQEDAAAKDIRFG